MGWCSDAHPEHEGFLVSLVKDDWRFRELGDRNDTHAVDDVRYVQMGCSCGWRSPRMLAPSGTRWSPCITLAAAPLEELGCELWKEHVAATTGRDGVRPSENGDYLLIGPALAKVQAKLRARDTAAEIMTGTGRREV